MKPLIPALIVVHRYLGLAFCLIFLIWFASGIVMVFKRMPEYTAEERLARLPALDADAIRVTPADALAAADISAAPRRVQLTSFRLRPVYRFAFDYGTEILSAEDGRRIRTASPENAAAIVAELFPESQGRARYLDTQHQPDQWTFSVAFRITGPLHRVSLGDTAATEVYVARNTGDVVMKTDRAARFWGYLGPVLHWFYFTPLRLQGPLWSNLVIYGSVVGCVLCLLGLVIGLYRFSIARRYARGTSVSPYVGWMRWHHYAGLLFGLVTFTWTLSGLFTMAPWNLFTGSGPSPAQVSAIRGQAVELEQFTVTPRDAVAAFERQFAPKEIDFVQFMGNPFYAAYQPPDGRGPAKASLTGVPARGPALRRVLMTGDEEPRVRGPFTQDELLAAADAAMPGLQRAEVTWLTEFDAYYYNRTMERGLPALRVKYADPQRTWLYLDSHDGTLVQAQTENSRVERWLYQGLHSLDFPGLYETRWAWYVVVIGLSVGGTALSFTSIVIGWRFLRRKVRGSAADSDVAASAARPHT